jgi:hypothetical protein
MPGPIASGTGDRGSPWPDANLGATGDTLADECPWCRTADQTDGSTCLNCGRTVGSPSSSSPSATPPPEVAAGGPAQATSWPPPPPPPPPQAPSIAVVVDPTVVARRRRVLQERAAQTEVGPSRPLTMLGWVGVAVVFAAIFAIVLTTRDSDGGRASETLPSVSSGPPVTTVAQVPPVVTAAPVITTVPPLVTSAPVTVFPTVPATTTPAPTAPPVTSPATTAPAATAPVTQPPTPSTSPATSAPAPVPQSGPGSPQVLNDPLPSGATAQAVGPAFALAQRLADALANEQWDTARSIDVDARGSSDQAFETGYGGLDRASLMLLDAVPEDGGYRLLVVSVANELGGAQTSLYCLEWTANTEDGTVDQHSGTVGLLARVSEVISPEAVRNDPALDRTVRDDCHWRSSTR